MSMGDADAKFPNQHTGIPPSPTRENPAQVYPKSDPSPAPRKPHAGDDNRAQVVVGNPFLLQGALEHLDNELARVVGILEDEEKSQGRSRKEDMLLIKFKGWRNELAEMVQGSSQTTSPPQATSTTEGGIFTD